MMDTGQDKPAFLKLGKGYLCTRQTFLSKLDFATSIIAHKGEIEILKGLTGATEISLKIIKKLYS